MNRRKERTGESRLVDIEKCCAYFGIGEAKMRELAKEYGFEVKIGRLSRFDLRRADAVINQLVSN